MATTTLGNKAVGSIIQLKENGKLVSFYVAKHNYENSLNGMGRTLVVRSVRRASGWKRAAREEAVCRF